MKLAAASFIHLLLSISVFYSSAASASDAVVPNHHVELFDGKSFSGWTFVSANTNEPADSIWSVTNGVIRCLGKPNGYARTLQFYRDYQLHVEWRWPVAPGNSGVFVHLNPPDRVWPMCFEAQLLAGNAGELRLNGGSHLAAITDPKVIAVPRLQPVSEKPTGEWNACDIICRSNTISIRMNGVLQNEAGGASLESGAIGLQAEGKLVEFRNVYLDPLPSGEK
jgi:hypothetical protein